MKQEIIIDIDGTLSDLAHRLHFIKPIDGGKKDYDRFFDEMYKDGVHEYCAEICRIFAVAGHGIVFITGRPDSHKVITETWLKHKARIPYFDLLMRKTGDYRKASVVKEELFLRNFPDSERVLFAIDDDPAVVDMYHHYGVNVLKVKGNF